MGRRRSVQPTRPCAPSTSVEIGVPDHRQPPCHRRRSRCPEHSARRRSCSGVARRAHLARLHGTCIGHTLSHWQRPPRRMQCSPRSGPSAASTTSSSEQAAGGRVSSYPPLRPSHRREQAVTHQVREDLRDISLWYVHGLCDLAGLHSSLRRESTTGTVRRRDNRARESLLRLMDRIRHAPLSDASALGAALRLGSSRIPLDRGQHTGNVARRKNLDDLLCKAASAVAVVARRRSDPSRGRSVHGIHRCSNPQRDP